MNEVFLYEFGGRCVLSVVSFLTCDLFLRWFCCIFDICVFLFLMFDELRWVRFLAIASFCLCLAGVESLYFLRFFVKFFCRWFVWMVEVFGFRVFSLCLVFWVGVNCFGFEYFIVIKNKLEKMFWEDIFLFVVCCEMCVFLVSGNC